VEGQKNEQRQTTKIRLSPMTALIAGRTASDWRTNIDHTGVSIADGLALIDEIERLWAALWEAELYARRQGAMKTASGIAEIAHKVGVHYGK
jgi:hypothetical protein